MTEKHLEYVRTEIDAMRCGAGEIADGAAEGEAAREDSQFEGRHDSERRRAYRVTLPHRVDGWVLNDVLPVEGLARDALEVAKADICFCGTH